MLRIRVNPGQDQVKYECVEACARPPTNTVASEHSVTNKSGCSVQRIMTNINNMTALKRATTRC